MRTMQSVKTKEELEKIIYNAQKQLEALNREKADIYAKMPKNGDLYYFYDRMTNKVVFWTCKESKGDELRFDRIPLHRTVESANLEKNFWVEVYKLKKEFVPNEENFTFNYNSEKDYISVLNHKLYMSNPFYFTEKDAKYLINKFGSEIIKSALFGIK